MRVVNEGGTILRGGGGCICPQVPPPPRATRLHSYDYFCIQYMERSIQCPTSTDSAENWHVYWSWKHTDKSQTYVEMIHDLFTAVQLGEILVDMPTHMHMHTRTRTHTHARTHARTHAPTHIHMHAHTHTHARTHAHTAQSKRGTTENRGSTNDKTGANGQKCTIGLMHVAQMYEIP